MRLQTASAPERKVCGNDEGKLLATVARHEVALADELPEHLGYGVEHRVADLIRQVIDPLKVVDIDERHTERGTLPCGTLRLERQPLLEVSPVGESGQGVPCGFRRRSDPTSTLN